MTAEASGRAWSPTSAPPSTTTGRRLPVLMDIAGPKVQDRPACSRRPTATALQIGDTILLCPRDPAARSPTMPFQMTCTAAARSSTASRSATRSRSTTASCTASSSAAARRLPGAHRTRQARAASSSGPEKGLNFPNVDLGLDPLTDKDRDDLDFIVGHADLIGHSFVQTADARRRAPGRARATPPPTGGSFALVGKIETPRAVRNLPEIIVQAAGRQPFAVMIARGDLAVEMGFERVAEMQEEIMWLCEAAHVPVIWATQVLEELVKKGLPSRGEMTDAAMAARAECVHAQQGTECRRRRRACSTGCSRRMGEHQVKKTPTLRALHAWERPAAVSIPPG